MVRAQSIKIALKNQSLVAEIKMIKQNHPFWGYRRVWAYLTYHLQFKVNKKRIYRLMQTHLMCVKESRQLKAKRVAYPSKPRASRVNQIWGTDMTKVKLPQIGWAYIVLVLDWHSKKIVGYSLAHRSKTQDWLDALNLACQKQFPQGIRCHKGLSLVSDNGCQPTSAYYMSACSTLGIEQIFTSYNNPKGNADTERMIRTMKEELIWSNELQSFEQLRLSLAAWVREYNSRYLHSSLGYVPPETFEKRCLDCAGISPLIAA